jgi:hypothetical protein
VHRRITGFLEGGRGLYERLGRPVVLPDGDA